MAAGKTGSGGQRCGAGRVPGSFSSMPWPAGSKDTLNLAKNVRTKAKPAKQSYSCAILCYLRTSRSQPAHAKHLPRLHLGEARVAEMAHAR